MISGGESVVGCDSCYSKTHVHYCTKTPKSLKTISYIILTYSLSPTKQDKRRNSNMIHLLTSLNIVHNPWAKYVLFSFFFFFPIPAPMPTEAGVFLIQPFFQGRQTALKLSSSRWKIQRPPLGLMFPAALFNLNLFFFLTKI